MADNAPTLYTKISKGVFEKPSKWNSLDEDVKDFITQLFEMNPINRLGFRQADKDNASLTDYDSSFKELKAHKFFGEGF